MTMFTGSRYRLLEPLQVTTADEEEAFCHQLRKTTLGTLLGSRRYTTQAGDTMESLAFEAYGDATKWYIIADANPQVFFPLDLEVGVEIVIPPKSFAELR